MKKLYIVTAFILSLFIFTSCTDNNIKTTNKTENKTSTVSQSEIKIIKNNINMGEIPMSEGKVKIPFEFINTGTEDIILGDAETTCMCTEAVVVDVEGKNPSGNITMRGHGAVVNVGKTIKPGEKAFLVATYNPNAHGPDAVGPIDRSVFIKTNSKKMPELRFKFYGEVVKERSTPKIETSPQPSPQGEGVEQDLIEEIENKEELNIEKKNKDFEAKVSEGSTDFMAFNIHSSNFENNNSKIDQVLEESLLKEDKVQIILESSNHAYSYADIDYLKNITLGAKNPESFKIIANKMGGHHVIVLLDFEAGTQIDTLKFNDSPVGNISLVFNK